MYSKRIYILFKSPCLEWNENDDAKMITVGMTVSVKIASARASLFLALWTLSWMPVDACSGWTGTGTAAKQVLMYFK